MLLYILRHVCIAQEIIEWDNSVLEEYFTVLSIRSLLRLQYKSSSPENPESRNATPGTRWRTKDLTKAPPKSTNYPKTALNRYSTRTQRRRTPILQPSRFPIYTHCSFLIVPPSPSLLSPTSPQMPSPSSTSSPPLQSYLHSPVLHPTHP